MKNIKKIALLATATLLLTPVISVSQIQDAKADSTGNSLVVSKTTQTKTQTLGNTATSNTSDITQNEHFDTNTIAYYITPGTAKGVQQDIRAAALQWNMQTKVNLYESKDKNSSSIVFTNSGTSSAENGLTTNTINKSKGYTEVISSKIDLSKTTIPQATLSTMGRRVVEHELGHALGLKDTHTDSDGSIMWYKTPNTDITAKDVAAINLYYK
ncbi:matrixin family metalloprotease [Companilactobacillus ginsenosidimutans]|uniref:Peptidase metallopeptidase domain-containing protein n=1 Tax=Companilactobacillus ginsenosidimutans TaxID=1007676 RepID=A0A0H4R2H3_9LACO|nr:matrixin family metalloprotease [Companilactobacillus ginsenosidimutans]AKP67925.1 hypothetical protein ABM34_10550 [Companilactobacillus ginsenosidimutans]